MTALLLRYQDSWRHYQYRGHSLLLCTWCRAAAIAPCHLPGGRTPPAGVRESDGDTREPPPLDTRCTPRHSGATVTRRLSMIWYSDRPFVWYPLAGQRHAIQWQDRTVRLGAPMRCLCGATHPRGPDGDTEWLWPTCPPCWDQACIIVGIYPRR